MSISDLNVLKRTNNLELSVDNNDDAKLIYQNLKEKAHDWKDTELNGQFEKGAEIFGYGKMFDFAKPGRRHDALYAFDRIIKLYETSGLTNRQFYNNILLQVSKDTGRMENDDSGGYTSHQRLNDITKSFREDIDNVIKEAKEFNTLKRLRGLAEGITGVKDIFQNFKMLSQYHELTKVLLEKEFIDALSKDQNQKRRDYVDTLFYHPTIENKQSVKDFWQNPEVFLSANASHASGKIHDNKKPSNYHQIPNLDLTPENMRDVLIEGGMDEIQAWEPLEIGYRVPKNVDKYQELESRDFQQMLLEALGKRGETKGKVKQPEKTAKLVVDILGIKLSDLKDVVSGDITPTDEQKKTIVDLVFFDKRGYNHKSEKYLAKINLKSDPDGLVAGNDTKTCDPFGDGKNVLYTYNPICASFTLQKEIQKGKFTTIGQSILTKDKDVGVNISKLKEKLEENGHIKFEEEVPESVLREAKSIIAADSIEVSDNYRTGKYSQIISDLYKDFFAEYINRYAERDNLDPSKVVTGSCSYGLANLSSDKNTFLPESPVSYSDKYKDDVHVIDFSKPRGKYFIKEVFIKEKPRKEEVSIDEKNVHYLTHQDTLPTAYLEGKIYSDTSMQQGLHEMENTLIAKDINNAHKDRPNMSLKYVNNEGKMQGYMVAFEGEIGVNRYEETKYDGEKCVYVMDIAKSSESVKGGVSLINGFIELYKKNYIDKNNTIPIFAEMREKTSFNLVMKKLDKLTAGTGKKFEVEELGTWNSEEAGDTRHVVIIRCVDA